MTVDTLILNVGGRSLHDGRHLGAGVGALSSLLDRDYGRTAQVLDPLQWNDTNRLLRHISSWASGGPGAAMPVSSARLVFISTFCTLFVREGSSFAGLALSSSIQGRPSTMLRTDQLLAAITKGDNAGGVVLVLDLTVVPSRRNMEIEETSSVTGLLLREARSWSVDVLLCAISGTFDLAASSDYRPQELGILRALKSLADRAKPFSVTDIHAEMTRRVDDLHGVSVFAQAADRSPPSLLQPIRTAARFPDYIVDDLYSSGPGSRLDAIVELSDIVSGRSDEGDPVEARSALLELLRTDPDPTVRAECLRTMEEAVRLTVDDLTAMEICHPEVDRRLAGTPTPEFVTIPAGCHRIGVDSAAGQWFERPQFSVDLPSFAIARTPITNAQYYHFAKETGWPVPANWVSDTFLLSTPNHPVVYVSYYDAVAYCEWLTERLGNELPYSVHVSLPTELEWEAAARWPDRQTHPWGERFDGRYCNTLAADIGEIVRTGQFSPSGDTTTGLIDVIGNVWEWTESLWGSSGRAPATLYPLVDDEDRAYRSAPSNVRRIVRGAAYYYTDECANSYTRNRAYPDDMHKAGGFRPVMRDS